MGYLRSELFFLLYVMSYLNKNTINLINLYLKLFEGVSYIFKEKMYFSVNIRSIFNIKLLIFFKLTSPEFIVVIGPLSAGIGYA